MSELIEFAREELDRVGKDDEGMQELMNKCILEIVEKFSEQGHSGFSANYEISVLERLLRFLPLTPLTGEDDEWMLISNDMEYQNKRCSHVFKKADGSAYDLDGRVFSDNGGLTWYSNKESIKTIKFPYKVPTYPEKVYIEYLEDVSPGHTSDNYEIITDKPERIKALYEKYSDLCDEGEKDGNK